MAIDRRFIGWRVEPAYVDVEKHQLRLFAKACGEDNPIYFDEAAARASGHPSLPAPPTFAFCLKALSGQPYSYLAEMGVDIARLLHGEQSFEYFAQIHAGDRIRLDTVIVDITAKKAGAFDVITAQCDATNAAGRHCVRQRSVFIVRYGDIQW